MTVCEQCGTVINDLPWVVEAKRYLGLRELTGRNDSPVLDKWWDSFGWRWLRNEAWCGLYMAVVFRNVGIKPPKAAYRAANWLNWGRKLSQPQYGCVVVIGRKGGNHVFIFAGWSQRGWLMGYGGNQSNKVSLAEFDPSRVRGFRAPLGFNLAAYQIPRLVSGGQASSNEA